MFVLATVGTDHHPFDRFVEWVDAWYGSNPDCELFVQRGTCNRIPKGPSSQWLEADELDAMMKRADVIICHGGPSTIMEARHAGVLPIVIPRDPAFGEHVDQHQMRFAEFMAVKNCVRLARSAQELAEHLAVDPSAEMEPIVVGDPTATLGRISGVIDDLMSQSCRPLLGAKKS